ncbi:NAD(P)-binding protein [Schizophyllum commune H4-8]|uniref:Ketoreductase domain-containing protein n=1 Tax=Schizophyllum commune (strain H4-8 / FGSC 9210) TaxID=578458 RepID=D8QC25_SCHCM|nr:NAD(P)-binding protein [Schizophyllum commune H4-8]KAI5889412.1 NAD(P)-binding protein [Schizophyllum commune H4-8]
MTSPTHLPLAGRVAIVTGASRGIGEHIAFELAKRGAKVMITFTSDSSQKRADDLVARIAALNNGSAAATVKADLRLLPSSQQIVDATLTAFSTQHIHILVNNAAVEFQKPAIDVTPEDYASLFDINVRGAYFMSQAVARVLGDHGRIVNLSSIAGRAASQGFSLYCASKAALEGMTRAWAVELGLQGHTVNVVAPGPVQSDMLDKVPAELKNYQKAHTPMERRFGTGDDIAQIVAWLAEESSRWITGQTISATGGYAMY